jgi:hypothetical protein
LEEPGIAPENDEASKDVDCGEMEDPEPFHKPTLALLLALLGGFRV